MLLQQVMAAHDHAGRAEAALQAVFLPKALLDSVQPVATSQTFDRSDFVTLSLDSKHSAGFHSTAVHENRAGTTERSLTSYMRAGESGEFAQEMDKEQARLNWCSMLDSIDGNGDVLHRPPRDERQDSFCGRPQ